MPVAASLTEAQLRRVAVDGTDAEILGLGIYTSIFLYTLSITWQRWKRGGMSIGIILTLIGLYACAVIHCGLTWWYTVKEIEEFGSTAGLVSHIVRDQPRWYVIVGTLAFTFSTVIADSINIWRCFVILGSRLWLIIPPAGALIAGFVLAMLSLTAHIHRLDNPTAPLTLHDAKFASFSTPYLCLSLGSTLYTTILIVFRIFMVTRGSGVEKGALPSSGGLTRCIELIVESALLYSIAHCVAVAFLVDGSGSFVYAQNLLPQFAGIAPTLLLMRVSMGYTQPTSWNEEPKGQSLSLRFAPMQELSHGSRETAVNTSDPKLHESA